VAQSSESRAATEAQRDHWNSLAAAWAEWWPVIEAGARPVSEAMVGLAEIGPGDRVLDLASGVGEPAATAARRVGPGGSVVATDLAPDMIERGRERARALGLGNLEFHLMDASAPDLPASSFDVALCRWGFMFIPDLDLALARLKTLLKPGGRLAVAVWGPAEQVPAISLVTRILTRELDLPPPGEDAATPFDLADTHGLERRLRDAGFTGFRHRPVTARYDFPSSDAFLAFRRALSGIEDRMTHIAADRREAAWGVVDQALEPYRTPDGRIVMENLSPCLGCRLA